MIVIILPKQKKKKKNSLILSPAQVLNQDFNKILSLSALVSLTYNVSNVK